MSAPAGSTAIPIGHFRDTCALARTHHPEPATEAQAVTTIDHARSTA